MDAGESGRRLGEIIDGAIIRDAIEAAGTKTMERLYLLVRKGYRPDLKMDFPGAIWLHHPSKGFNDWLFLYPDGCVKSAQKTDEFRFDLDEDARFQRFLRSVPKPTFWDRTRDGRMNFLGWIVLGSVSIGGGVLVMGLWRFFGFK